MTTNASPAVLQAGAVLTTSAVAYVTCVSSVQVVMKRTVFTNATAGPVSFSAYRVPVSGTAGATNVIIDGRSIAAGGSDLAPELSNMVLNPGETIQALAGAATSINMFSSGFVTS